MPSYVYITGRGADPDAGSIVDDPLFGPVPTLGACMPNLRRKVELGDWLFVVSGSKPQRAQYLFGGLRVAERINALTAYERFPEQRLRLDERARLRGNVPVDATGAKHPLDRHAVKNFERRIENFLVGDQAVRITDPAEVEIARTETLPFLSQLRGKVGNRVYDVIGRASKLDNEQVEKMLEWFDHVKRVANEQRR